MNNTAEYLGLWDMAVATLLVVVTGAVSFGLRLGLERRLAWAAFRTILQLLLLGYILSWVFDITQPWRLVPIIAVMLTFASRAALQRAGRRYRGAYLDALATLTLSSLVTTVIVTRVIINVPPWYNPQYLIPLLGMILGNGLTGISLCLDDLLEGFSEGRELVEMELAHGATRWEASREVLQNAVRRGMIPNINAMMVVGIVSLPGMMTGQILAGSDPLQAVRYQVVVMFMIAAATATSCMGVALLAYRRVTNVRHQLRAERITRDGGR